MLLSRVSCEQVLCFLAFFGCNTVVFLPGVLCYRTHTPFSYQSPAKSISWVSRLLLNNHGLSTQVLSSSSPIHHKERLFIPCLERQGLSSPLTVRTQFILRDILL